MGSDLPGQMSGQNQGQVCKFPFSIDGHEFYDCTYYNNADICKCFINFEICC